MQRFLFATLALTMFIFSSCSNQAKVSPESGDKVETIINNMSLKEKVGQLFIVNYSSYSTNREISRLIKRDKVGGLILMESDPVEHCERMNALQKKADIPLLITIDGEWGASMRFDTLTQYPRNMQLGALSSEALVYEVGKSMATQFRRLGIHVNYAPTVDINNNPKNPVIGTRSFGDDREKVAKYGSALFRGLQDGGVGTSAKHFPGHGDTEVDSHKALPLLPFGRERLDSLELYPFKKAIADGVWMIMVGHLSIPALDSTLIPSSISYPIITNLLKEELGYKGIVITDALNMKGVSEYIPAETVATESFKAGSDLLLMPPKNYHKSINNLYKAVKRGEISEERVNESLRKMLKLKEHLGILESVEDISPENIFADLENKEVLDLIQEVSDSSVTLIKAPSYPLDKNNKRSLYQKIADSKAIAIELDKRISTESLDAAKASAEGKECVVLYLPELRAPKNDRELYSKLSPDEIYAYISNWAKEQKIVLAIMDTPYVLDKIDIPAFDGIIVGYSTSEMNKRSVSKVLNGEIVPHGVLPVVAGGFPNGYNYKNAK